LLGFYRRGSYGVAATVINLAVEYGAVLA